MRSSKAVYSKLVWIASIAYFMQSLDATILHTALPSIAKRIGAPAFNMQAVIISYVMMVAVLSPLTGWLADRFGTRRIFSLAIIVFSLGSLLCACASSLNFMIVARSVQGIGGAMMMPVARLILLRAYPKDELLHVLNVVTVAGLIGPIAGPLLGGVITTYASWKWIFLINLPLGLIGLFVTYRDVPDFRKPTCALDRKGCLLLSLGLLIFTFSLEQTNHQDGLGPSLLLLVLGSFLLFLYVLHARQCGSPLFDLAIFRIKTFSIGLSSNLLTRLGVTCMPLMVPLMLQTALGHTPLYAGLLVFNMAIGALLIKPFVPAILRRWRYRKTLITANLTSGFLIGLLSIPVIHTSALFSALVLFSLGIANSIQFTAMNTLTLCDLNEHNTSEGNTLLVICQMVALSFSLTLGAALLQIFQSVQSEPIMSFRYTFLCLSALTWFSCTLYLLLKPEDGKQMLKYDDVVEFK